MQYFGAPDPPTPPNPNSGRAVDPTGIPRRTDCMIGFDNGYFPNAHPLDFAADNQSTETSSSPRGILSPGIGSDATKSDCTRVALSIVEQLDTSKRRWNGTASPYGAGGLTATEACQRLLTILVCILIPSVL